MKIAFLLIFFLVSIGYAEMPGLEGYLLSDSTTTITLVYDYIVSKSSNYTWIQQQVLDYNIDVSSDSHIKFIIRLPLNNQSIRDEIEDKCIWFKDNYGSTIIEGYLKKHKCFNDGVPGRSGHCEWTLLWEK